MKKKGLVVGIILFGVFLVAAGFLYNKLSSMANFENDIIKESQSEGSDQENKAIDFTVYDYEGNEVKLSDKIGKPLVVNFWASWCPPCKAELPDFEEVYKEIGDKVEFMMVNAVGGRETAESGKAYFDEQGYTFPVYFDNDQDASVKYAVTSIPVTIFIDKDGNVVVGASGMIDKETLLKGIGMITDDTVDESEEQMPDVQPASQQN